MPRSLVLLLYNITLPLFFVIAFPGWLIKMWRRGGYGTGLLERFALFNVPAADEPKQVVYIHAVSVGEVLLAIKLIKAMGEKWPKKKIVLAATTSTGHAVAREKSPEGVRVIYSPLDFNFIVRAVFRRFLPETIVLIESEAWPNLLRIAQKKSIPVVVANARLSERSEARFLKFRSLFEPIFSMISKIGVQDEGDKERFEGLGIDARKIHLTGSIKFDPVGGGVPQKREEFDRMLEDFGNGRPVVLIASSHGGEEKQLAGAVKRSGENVRLVVVPRHAERRGEVIADLESIGYHPVLKTEYRKPSSIETACLVVDTTGELGSWTAHADLVVIGKSWIGKGGQNPAEAIAAGVPVVCGPHMGNFQPLISQLVECDAATMLDGVDQLGECLSELLGDPSVNNERAQRALEVLSRHDNAVEKTLKLI